MQILPFTFGDRIRKARRQIAHLTQAELGEKLGVHSNTIVGWESGRNWPSGGPEQLQQLANALGVDIEWLDPTAEARNRCFIPAPDEQVAL